MRAVDTHALVRLIARDDADQASRAESFIERGAWVSHVVLVEALWVLDSVFGLRRAQLARAVEMLLNHRQLTFQEPEVAEAALAHFKTHSGVDFSDCMILEIAKKAGHLPLGTFDRRLGKLDDTAIL
jgi:predicted nucleic-acid-binding protein